MFFRRLPLTLLALMAAFTGEVRAESLIEPDYDGTGPKLTTPWFGKYSAANQKSDMDFIIGMRPHHAGALTMSEEYLVSLDKQSRRLQDLAKGIIRNQSFEILMLDTVEGHVKNIEFASDKPEWHQIATGRLAKRERFMRAPIPSSILKNDPSSAEDVRFAKAMIVHHEGALIMCEGYLSNPDTNNTYVERMCLDILRDQAQEIALMQAVINDYPGDADAITIDPSMVHGMEGMDHGSHHSGHGGHSEQSEQNEHSDHNAHSGHGHHQE